MICTKNNNFYLFLFTVTNQILCQDSSYETCHVWGDPHLLMFPMHPSQADTRAIYWCRSPGRMLILKNKYIEVSVIVTDKPFYNENVSQILNLFLYVYHLYFIV